MARIPGAQQAAHHHGCRAALVSSERHVGLALWNAINSIVVGALIFAVLYGVGFLAWKQDPNMLESCGRRPSSAARYDPGKWAAAPWTLLIRR